MPRILKSRFWVYVHLKATCTLATPKRNSSGSRKTLNAEKRGTAVLPRLHFFFFAKTLLSWARFFCVQKRDSVSHMQTKFWPVPDEPAQWVALLLPSGSARTRSSSAQGKGAKLCPPPSWYASLGDPTPSSHMVTTSVSIVTKGRHPHLYSKPLRPGQLSLSPTPSPRPCPQECNFLKSGKPGIKLSGEQCLHPIRCRRWLGILTAGRPGCKHTMATAGNSSNRAHLHVYDQIQSFSNHYISPRIPF